MRTLNEIIADIESEHQVLLANTTAITLDNDLQEAAKYHKLESLLNAALVTIYISGTLDDLKRFHTLACKCCPVINDFAERADKLVKEYNFEYYIYDRNGYPTIIRDQPCTSPTAMPSDFQYPTPTHRFKNPIQTEVESIFYIRQPSYSWFTSNEFKVDLAVIYMIMRADNLALFKEALSDYLQSSQQDLLTTIYNHHLIYAAIGLYAMNILQYLLSLNVNLDTTVKVQDAIMNTGYYVHTPLSYAAYAAQIVQEKIDRDSATKLIQTLLDAGADTRFKVTNYHGNHGTLSRKISIAELDTTGIFSVLIRGRDRSQGHSGTGANTQLERRVTELERLSQTMATEIAALSAELALLRHGNAPAAIAVAATRPTTTTTTINNRVHPHPASNGDGGTASVNPITTTHSSSIRCRFYRAGAPDSCKRGSTCKFSHSAG